MKKPVIDMTEELNARIRQTKKPDVIDMGDVAAVALEKERLIREKRAAHDARMKAMGFRKTKR